MQHPFRRLVFMFSTCVRISTETTSMISERAARGRRPSGTTSVIGALERSFPSSRSPQLPPEAALSVVVLRYLGCLRVSRLAAAGWVKSLSLGSWRGRKKTRDSFNPDSKMDVLKSEILRKRQLVEDRNLLVVRSLGVVGVGDAWRSWVFAWERAWGEGNRAERVLSGWGSARTPPGPQRGRRYTHCALGTHSGAFGMEVWELQENPRLAVLLLPIPVCRYFSYRPSFFLVVHFCHFKKALHFMCASCFVAQDIRKMWLRTTT